MALEGLREGSGPGYVQSIIASLALAFGVVPRPPNLIRARAVRAGLDLDDAGPYLPSEAKQVTGHHARWTGEGVTVDQTVVAYPNGVAQDIVAEVRETVTCTEYSAGQTQHTQVKAVTLPEDIAQPDAAHAWCLQSSNGGEVCYSVLAQQDLISSIWTKADSREEALDVLTVTTALAAKRIQVQIR